MYYPATKSINFKIFMTDCSVFRTRLTSLKLIDYGVRIFIISESQKRIQLDSNQSQPNFESGG
jgi:hypothetical protein